VRTPVGLKCPVCGAQPGRGFRPQRRATWAVPVVVAVVVLAVLGLPRLLGGRSDQTGVDTQGPPAGAGAPGNARFAGIGQETKDANLTFVVSALDCGATQVDAGAVTRVAQGHFCFLSLDLRNDGKNPATFVARTQTLVDFQNRRFEPDAAATSVHPANAGRDFLSVTVNPGNQLRGVLVFDIPPDVVPMWVALRAGPQGPGAVVLLRQREAP
jgi:hypothetical protein